jgi:hypothetical protein
MKFEEALAEMRKGKKIRRKEWGLHFYMDLNGECISCYNCDGILSVEDLINDDWEVVEDAV